eukprot:1984045-Amphidinium_carterae.1
MPWWPKLACIHAGPKTYDPGPTPSRPPAKAWCVPIGHHTCFWRLHVQCPSESFPNTPNALHHLRR